MGLLDRLRGFSLHPAWHYAAHGTLWQIQVGSPRFLLGEARDQEKKTVSFFSIDRETGEVHWEGVNPVGSWWAGVEGIFGEIVLFHGFATPDLPIHKGIFAVDGRNGTLLWSEPVLRFLWCSGGIVGARPIAGESGGETLLGLETGRVMEGKTVEGYPLPSSRSAAETAAFPSSLGQFTDSEPDLVDALRRAVPSGAVRETLAAIFTDAKAIVEYAVNLSTPDRQSHRVVIAVFDRKTGRRLFEATVLPDTPIGQPEPFFVQGGILFYVADRTSLYAVRLGNI